jgi:hypothetical protein
MDMKEQLDQYVKNVKERYGLCRGNEEATKRRLIEPLFTTLGYDLADPAQCIPEDKAKFGKDRSKQPVDWAFFVNNSVAFLVEAKAVEKKIDRYNEQLGDYYAKQQGKVKLGILTTGVQWRFFTDLDNENLMDNVPFLEWDVLNGTIPFKFLTILVCSFHAFLSDFTLAVVRSSYAVLRLRPLAEDCSLPLWP